CNSLAPDDPGTVVAADAAVWPGAVKAIAHKTGLTVLQIASTRMLGAYGFLRALFEVFDRHRTVVDVVTTSEVSVSLTLEDAHALPAIVNDLRALGEVRVEPQRAIVCVVGEGLRTTPGIAARIFGTVEGIYASLISQSGKSTAFWTGGARVTRRASWRPRSPRPSGSGPRGWARSGCCSSWTRRWGAPARGPRTRIRAPASAAG